MFFPSLIPFFKKNAFQLLCENDKEPKIEAKKEKEAHLFIAKDSYKSILTIPPNASSIKKEEEIFAYYDQYDNFLKQGKIEQCFKVIFLFIIF